MTHASDPPPTETASSEPARAAGQDDPPARVEAPRPPSRRRGALALATLALAALVVVLLVTRRAPTKVAAPTAPATPSSPAAATKLVDLRGRAVSVHGPARRIAIDDSRYLVALGLLHPDPVSLLAAWAHDTNRLGTETYAQLLERSPGLEKLPKVASSAGSFDVESLLAALPDVALLSLESGITDAQLARLEGAGVPVVVVDFFVKPLENLERSLALLGALIGRDEQARAFIAFRGERMKRISERVAALPPDARPTVFLEAHAGMSADCCNSPGRGNLGDYLGLAGGRNIGADVIPQAFGKLNLEYVISRDPAVYIGTGGPHLEKAGGLVLGAGYDQARAHASLVKVTSRRGIAGLSAVKAGRAHGLSHHLVNSPLDIVAIEVFARWLHPDRFADVDPAATLAEINERFLALPYRGVYWVDLGAPDAGAP